MKLYRIKLPQGTIVGTKVLAFDHWVSVREETETQAKIKALSKLAYQLREKEPTFYYSNYTLREIRGDIDLGDLEVYE